MAASGSRWDYGVDPQGLVGVSIGTGEISGTVAMKTNPIQLCVRLKADTAIGETNFRVARCVFCGERKRFGGYIDVRTEAISISSTVWFGRGGREDGGRQAVRRYLTGTTAMFVSEGLSLGELLGELLDLDGRSA